MRIRATIEYEVSMQNYVNCGRNYILDQEQCRLIACLKYLWQTYTSARQSVKVEEIK